MLAELDVVIFLKSSDDLERTAGRIFSVLKSEYQAGTMETDPTTVFYETNGLGFHAALFPNTGELLDPEFDGFQYGLEITSQFWCADLDNFEEILSEYYARYLAFELNTETASEILIETTEESEIFEIRVYRRNPQYRMDQAPTTPKVFVIETRQVEESFDEQENTEEDFEEESDTEDAAR